MCWLILDKISDKYIIKEKQGNFLMIKVLIYQEAIRNPKGWSV